ncbi:glycosyltransferase family 4 protein [Sporosarcina sp. FA15]|uniref:glycosyltransferase family 4 protein n=1 Tax=Sporosarcina sp. FA15 TaxID=3413031 RepID=UPI003F659EC8
MGEKINSNMKGSGGWILTMLEELQNLEEIVAIDVVSTYKGKKVFTYIDQKIRYTLLPTSSNSIKYDKNLWKYIQDEILVFKPDLIDVHGIEFYLIKSLLEVKTKTPIVATLQGLTSEIYKHYYAGIPMIELLRNRTIRDNIFLDGIIERKSQYKKRGENEINSLKELKYTIGRTDWDRIVSMQHNQKLKYFDCNRNLRKEFYGHTWTLDSVDRYSLFTTQSHYPIKGLHILLEALSIIVEKFPGVCLYISGKNMLSRNTLFEKLTFSGYQKYISRLIKKLDLENHVIFTGPLNSSEIVNQLKKTHTFIMPSVIENSPNALAEAQLIGTPSVASFVGGIGDFVEDGISGLLYSCYEPVILADKVQRIFLDDEIARNLSTNAREIAAKRHNRAENTEKLIFAYKTIIKESENESECQ